VRSIFRTDPVEKSGLKMSAKKMVSVAACVGTADPMIVTRPTAAARRPFVHVIRCMRISPEIGEPQREHTSPRASVNGNSGNCLVGEE